MIKSLLFLSALLGVQTMPVHTDDQYVGQHVRQYQHTEDIGGNTEVTYKYETNEVNSIDDLVVGNIYKMETSSFYSSISTTSTLFLAQAVYAKEGVFSIDIYNDSSYCSYGYSSSRSTFVISFDNFVYYTDASQDIYFVYHANFDNTFIQYVSSSDFNVIESVVYNAPTSLFGLMADFFDQYIYSGIPHINDINYEVNGQTITMKDWLVVSTTIAVVILFLFILFFIFRWLIRTFSNAFLWR